MFKHNAFTMIELIFVIVIMGIIGKFGVEFLAQSYRDFIFSKINHELQATSAAAVEIIAARLQHRIKDSVIARTAPPPSVPVAIANADGSLATYTVLEWIGVDEEGFQGNSDTNSIPYLPNWSGIIDVDNNLSNSTVLVSPETNTTSTNTMINNLSYGTTTLNDAAIFFPGANSATKTDYGWDGNISNINTQNGAMHPIKSNGIPNQFVPATGTFTGIDIYEYYKLAWTAYAIVHEANGTLRLYWNYQPWKDRNGDGKGDQFNDAGIPVKSAVIMENVSTFQFIAIGDIIKIQVCTKSTVIDGINDGQGYSLCKEKTIF